MCNYSHSFCYIDWLHVTWRGISKPKCFYSRTGYNHSEIFETIKRKPLSDDSNTTGMGGMKDDGHMYFQSMHKNTGTTTVPDHHACTTIICGRLGTLVEAKEILDQMGVELDVIIWKAFMAAYRVYGNKETILPTPSKNWDPRVC